MLASIKIKQKQWQSATKLSRALLSIGDQPYKAHTLLGTIHQNQGANDEAAKEYQLVLKEKPANLTILRRLVETNIAQKKPELALQYLKNRLSVNSDDANSHELIGEILAWQKKTPEAEQSYLTALRMEPKLVIAYRQLARLYMQQKKPDKVLSTYQQGLAAIPDQPDLLMELATHYQNIDQTEKAITTYKQLVDQRPGNLYAVNNYAALIADSSNDKQMLSNALALTDQFKSTNQPAFLDTYGWLAYRLANYNDAVPALEKAVDLAPNYPVFRYHLGMAYYAVNREDAALRALTQAVESEGANFVGIDDAKKLIEKMSNNS
jgi:tetratricopeptide (TPR) repeat protein